VVPVVTYSAASIAATATSVTINGFGFGPTAANDTVTFSGTVKGTVTAATATQVTVSNLTGLIAGPLTATVTCNGMSSTAAVEVATVTPVAISNTASTAANATTLTIHGFGFAAGSTVTFNSGAGTVTAVTSTTLTVSYLGGLIAGPLTATVHSNGFNSAPVVVATVVPGMTASTVALAGNATSLTIYGFGFSPIAANNIVTFSNGTTGIVTASNATTLVVSKLTGLVGGPLAATVTSNGISSAIPIQVAKVVPVVTYSAASVPASATSLIINGFGFSPTAANDTVTFTNGVKGIVTAATPTQLTVHILTSLVVGSLSATVTSNGVTSTSAVQVAIVKAS
jgi:hypothetical protein